MISADIFQYCVSQMVQFSDLKPAPALWHEGSGRRPWENGRQPAGGHQMDRSVVKR